MQILKSTFFYTLLVLLAIGGVFALMPDNAAAQTRTYCDIDIIQAPITTAIAGEAAGPFHIAGSCGGPTIKYYTYGLKNVTDDDWMIRAPTVWRYYFESHPDYFDATTYYTFNEPGEYELMACAAYDASVDSDNWCDASDTLTITVQPAQCTLSNPTISGPTPVQLPSGYQYYPIGFNHTGDAVDYRLNVVGHWLSGWYSTTADSINWGINWDNYSAGTYRICATARAKNAGSVCSDTKTSCMWVDVISEPKDAILHVESQNPSSGVGMDIVSGTYPAQRFTTSKTFRHNGDITMRVYADDDPSGKEFSHWVGCNYEDGDRNRACNVTVNQGSTKTITAVYNDPPTIGKATVYVQSSNPSSGVYIGGTGNLYSGYTSYTIQRDVDLSGSLTAPATVGNNNFSEWQGCDSRSGRVCYVSTALNSNQTVRAVYVPSGVTTVSGCTDPTATNYNSSANSDDGSCTYPASEPQYATIHIRSVNPSKISMGANNGNFNPSGTYYGIITPHTIQRDEALHDVVWVDSGWTNFSHWQGCDQVYYERGCGIWADPGQTRTITAFHDSPPAPGCTDPTATNYDSNADTDDGSCTYPAASVNSFSLSDPNINFNATPPELHVDDQPFTLVWSTSNANTVTGASSESTRWPGSKRLNGSDHITERNFKETSKIFNYSITAHGDGGNSSASLAVKLIDPPSFDLSSESETSIEGFPGSQATNDVTVTSRKYDGEVELEVRDEDIPSSLIDDDGNAKVSFTFVPDRVDTNGSSVLTIEMTGAVSESISETITITGTDLSDTAVPRVETTQFILNISGFNPQTIEEF